MEYKDRNIINTNEGNEVINVNKGSNASNVNNGSNASNAIVGYKEPSDLKISIHVITCNIGSDIKLYQLSRLLNIYDDKLEESSSMFKDEYGNFLSINNYSEEKKRYTDFPRGRMSYNLPSQVFNNQITLIYKYFGFKEINVKIFTNGELHMTGIKDVNYESKHVSEHLIKLLKNSDYYVWLTKDFMTMEKNKDFIVYYNSTKKELEYYRRNLNKYSIDNIFSYNKKKSKVNTSTNTCTNAGSTNDGSTNADSTNASANTSTNAGSTNNDDILNNNSWLSHVDIEIWSKKNIEICEKYIVSINKLKDYLLCENSYNDTDRCNIHNFLTKFKNIVIPIKDFMEITNKEYKSKLKVKINKIIKWLNYYKECVTKIKDTDLLFVDEIKSKYITEIMAKYEDNKKRKTNTKYITFDNDFKNINFKYSNLDIVNINCDFTTNYINNLDMIKEILEEKYNIYSTYNPDKKYPGILIKFRYNDKYTDTSKYSPGVCYCPTSCLHKSKPDCKYITISIFRPGSAMITGCKNIQQSQFVYSFIKQFIRDNFNYVCDSNIKNNDELLINENKKILRKNNLFYIKKSSVKY
jgi:TATA-box binding protein (TBP) (component of TFIID and TFIIIB)